MKYFGVTCFLFIGISFLYGQEDSGSHDDDRKTVITNERYTDMELWQMHQDSLRTVLLHSKENKLLKESILQEIYIRDVVKIKQNMLHFFIPLDMHGFSCMAPDCYSTDLSFEFPLKDKLVFPEEIVIAEHEHGCVDKETKIKGTFTRREVTAKGVLYRSDKLDRTMIILDKANVWYFSGPGSKEVTIKGLDTWFDNYISEDTQTVLHPYYSWILTTNEYENFFPERR